jgi:hypothetical protein
MITPCPYCGGDVVSTWAKVEDGGGMISDPSIVLVADWIYHAACWDKQIAEHPP